MKRNFISNSFAGILTAVAIFFFSYILQSALVGEAAPVDAGVSYSAPSAAPVSEDIHFTAPDRLSIPSISVDAKVQEVGLTAKGDMGIPTNFVDVAWYMHGPVPGEIGSAVIDGHVDNGLGLKGIFKRLKEVEPGDDIYIKDKEGNEIHFIVREIKEYPYKEAPAEEIFHESDRRLLRLITCGGKWIKSAKTYETRVVVTAEYVP